MHKKTEKPNDEILALAVEDYLNHLKKKLLNEGLIKSINDPKMQNIETKKQQKLANRYWAISSMFTTAIQGKGRGEFSQKDYEAVSAAVNTCKKNKPDWSERIFLQKLTDFLSLGLKPLYRSIFSKETALEKKIGAELDKKEEDDLPPSPKP